MGTVFCVAQPMARRRRQRRRARAWGPATRLQCPGRAGPGDWGRGSLLFCSRRSRSRGRSRSSSASSSARRPRAPGSGRRSVTEAPPEGARAGAAPHEARPRSVPRPDLQPEEDEPPPGGPPRRPRSSASLEPPPQPRGRRARDPAPGQGESFSAGQEQ